MIKQFDNYDVSYEVVSRNRYVFITICLKEKHICNTLAPQDADCFFFCNANFNNVPPFYKVAFQQIKVG